MKKRITQKVFDSIKSELQLIEALKLYTDFQQFHWNTFSITLKLSENFIREYKDKVNWNCITNFNNYQKTSLENSKTELVGLGFQSIKISLKTLLENTKTTSTGILSHGVKNYLKILSGNSKILLSGH